MSHAVALSEAISCSAQLSPMLWDSFLVQAGNGEAASGRLISCQMRSSYRQVAQEVEPIAFPVSILVSTKVSSEGEESPIVIR
jgi:hypothetical protein